MSLINQILTAAASSHASDIHISSAGQAMMRVRGRLIPVSGDIFSADAVWHMAEEMMNGEQLEMLRSVGECDFARHRTDGNLVFLAERLPLEGDDVVIGGAHAMQRHGYIEFETVLGYGLWNIPTDFKCFVSLTVIT